MQFFTRAPRWPELSLSEIRKRARLLVIDDQTFSYLELLKTDSYNVDKWDDVKDLTKIENGFYDLILLDIQGVGLQLTADQGLGILRHIKKSCPTQLIIAFSNADFSLEYKEFFDLADDALPKNADYVEFKRSVDALLGKRFTLGFYLERIVKEASPFLQNTATIRKAAEHAIRTGKINRLEKVMRRTEFGESATETVLKITKIAIGIGASLA